MTNYLRQYWFLISLHARRYTETYEWQRRGLWHPGGIEPQVWNLDIHALSSEVRAPLELRFHLPHLLQYSWTETKHMYFQQGQTEYQFPECCIYILVYQVMLSNVGNVPMQPGHSPFQSYHHAKQFWSSFRVQKIPQTKHMEAVQFPTMATQ